MFMSICSTRRDISSATGLQAVDGDFTVIIYRNFNIIIFIKILSVSRMHQELEPFEFIGIGSGTDSLKIK